MAPAVSIEKRSVATDKKKKMRFTEIMPLKKNDLNISYINENTNVKYEINAIAIYSYRLTDQSLFVGVRVT